MSTPGSFSAPLSHGGTQPHQPLSPAHGHGQEHAGAADAVSTYFECITACSIDDGECVTRCVEVLREEG
ncbi:MAG: hypothetical protein EBX49_02200 [Synechococcaceae bacterium WB8_1B_136]|nr:hypothetical protein [Synechococcaceae bacterium WB8_1B_136]